MNNNHALLNLLMEECAEVIVTCNKIIRFGPDFQNPNTGESNEDELHDEIGDLDAVIRLLDLNKGQLMYASAKKKSKIRIWSPEALERRNDEPTCRNPDINRRY